MPLSIADPSEIPLPRVVFDAHSLYELLASILLDCIAFRIKLHETNQLVSWLWGTLTALFLCNRAVLARDRWVLKCNKAASGASGSGLPAKHACILCLSSLVCTGLCRALGSTAETWGGSVSNCQETHFCSYVQYCNS